MSSDNAKQGDQPWKDSAFQAAVEVAARDAGKILKEQYEHGAVNEFKSDRQVVTEADRQSEQLLKEGLLGIYLCHFCGEESGGEVTEQGDYWVVDPLDGTENMTGYPPLFAVSIGLLHDGMPVLGVIYDPVHDRLYSASEGLGVKVNGRKAQISTQTDPTKAVISVDFSSNLETRKRTLEQLSRVLTRARTIKAFGAPVLSLAEVAVGRLDLFFRPSTKLPDMVAGVCMVREAGGIAVDYEGHDWTIRSTGIVAGSPATVEAYKACFK